MLVASNKADLCEELDIIKKISENFTTIPCSAETELLLRKATKAGLIDYISGNNNFSGKQDVNLSNEQNNALHIAKNVLNKIGVTEV